MIRQPSAAAVGLLLLLTACSTNDPAVARVGRDPDGNAQLPVLQTLTPHGLFVDLPGLRPQGLALSADGRHLYVSGKSHELLVLDAGNGAVVQRVTLPSDQQLDVPEPGAKELHPDRDGQLSYTGLIAAGDRIWLSNVRGNLKVFQVAADGVVRPSHTIRLPHANAPRRRAEIPSGLALSSDGRRLYVCGNLGNRLHEIDAATGEVTRSVDVGVAPFDVRIVGSRAYVSNWGGRRPAAGDLTGPAGRGTVVRVDPVRHIASEGSVSVVDLEPFTVATEIVTGLHASALAVSPDQRHVVVANAGSDHLSVLDVDSGLVIERIWCKHKPSDLLGATPNALVFGPDGKRLYVANGTQNAIGVIHFEPEDRESKLLGLIPVGWFPGALLFDAHRNRIVVANIKGIGFGLPRERNAVPEFNSHQYHGSLSLVAVPGDGELPDLSHQVEVNLRRDMIERSLLPPRPDQPARAIPERIGEPSLIRHVVYVIKENRTYDQVLGDLPQGNGDRELCIFGEQITPNQHALARQFVLFDNTYCAGILSADGHNWSTSAFANDYLEKSFAGWARSYPDGMGENENDALAWSPAGFLWDHALARGVTLRNYGEFCEPKVTWRDGKRGGEPGFMDCWRTWRGEEQSVQFGCAAVLPPLVPHSPAGTVGWSMAVPDQFRADFVIGELAEFERRGEFPQLVIICLPNDHTNGTSAGWPTPRATVADNDLAFGRIVEALSRSKFWPQMAIFGIEDDPQNGWDHVSGYRTTAYVASPFARRGVTVSTMYSTISLLRTIEQILGIPPMNQFDASAMPMSDCFTDTPDLTPFTALPANVALDELNPAAEAIADAQLRADAERSASFDLSKIDNAPEDALNRILWRAMKGSGVPYPEWAVTLVDDDDDDH